MTESNDETNKSQAKNTSIIKESINTRMSQSYLDYAYSVIIGRAIPDVRDRPKACPTKNYLLYACKSIQPHSTI